MGLDVEWMYLDMIFGFGCLLSFDLGMCIGKLVHLPDTFTHMGGYIGAILSLYRLEDTSSNPGPTYLPIRTMISQTLPVFTPIFPSFFRILLYQS